MLLLLIHKRTGASSFQTNRTPDCRQVYNEKNPDILAVDLSDHEIGGVKQDSCEGIISALIMLLWSAQKISFKIVIKIIFSIFVVQGCPSIKVFSRIKEQYPSLCC